MQLYLKQRIKIKKRLYKLQKTHLQREGPDTTCIVLLILEPDFKSGKLAMVLPLSLTRLVTAQLMIFVFQKEEWEGSRKKSR